jgi:hypothetical protein
VRLFLSLLAFAVSAAEPAADSGPLMALLEAPRDLLSSSDKTALQKGSVVARVLETTDRSEVLTLAAVRLRSGSASFRACAEDPSCLFGHDDLQGTGRIGAASAEEELVGLGLDAKDRDHLERCRVSQCGVRLEAATIARFQQEVDWKAADASAHAAALFRAVLSDLAVRYAREGDSGLVIYEDDERRTRVAETLALLLSRPAPLLGFSPGMRAHLQAFPASALESGLDYLCWRQERYWRQTLVSLEHVSVQETGEGAVVVAAKQLYASHYFDAAIAVFAYVPDGGSGSGLLVHMSRARADIRPTGFTWLERILLNRMVRGRLSRHLGALKKRLDDEAPVSAAHRTSN